MESCSLCINSFMKGMNPLLSFCQMRDLFVLFILTIPFYIARLKIGQINDYFYC